MLTLELDLILYDNGLALVVNLLGKFGGDGMMSSGVLDDETFIAFDALEDSGLFYCPLSNVGPVLLTLGVIFLGFGWDPSRVPIVGELLQKGGSHFRWLSSRSDLMLTSMTVRVLKGSYVP